MKINFTCFFFVMQILEILKLRMCYPLILLDSTGTDRVYHNGLKNRLWSQITVKLYDLGQGS